MMKERLTLSIFACILGLGASAAHFPGGNITYECLGNDDYEVTLQIFRECSGATLLDQDLHFESDCGNSFTLTLPVGTGVEVSQLCPADLPLSTCNGGTLPGIEVYEFTTTVNLSPCDDWTISWHICCRNTSLNVLGTPGLYLEAILDNTVSACNNSPEFSEAAAPYVCVNQPVSYDMGVTEGDGDMLTYSFIDARFAAPVPTPVAYSGANSGSMPYPGMSLDQQTGQITFTPDMVGYIIIAVQVDELNANGDTIGSVMRDIAFVVINCANNNPDPNTGLISNLTGMAELVDSTSITLCPGHDFCFDAVINDPDSGQMLTLSSNITTVLSNATFNTIGMNPVTATACWTAPTGSSGFYTFSIQAEDDACPQTAVQSYVYSVTVLADNDSSCITTNIAVADTGPELTLFPNPTSGQFRFIANAHLYGQHSFRLFDLTGKLHLSGTIDLSSGAATLQVPLTVTNGTYLFHLGSDQAPSQIERVTILR